LDNKFIGSIFVWEILSEILLPILVKNLLNSSAIAMLYCVEKARAQVVETIDK
jgi:hypothetical protein